MDRSVIFSLSNEVADTTVPAGTRTGAAGAQADAVGDYAAFASPHSKLVPSVQMQCRMTAIFRATATFAFLARTNELGFWYA